MGTRGLTIVISDSKTKVAQYGQWDHYPSGQGVTILKFLRETNLKKFKKKLESVRFMTKRKHNELNDFLKSIGSVDGWIDLDQAIKYHEKYPYLNRDHGADILNMIMGSTDKIIWLQNSTSFGKDGTFCEYTYVIDLDKKVFKCYSGSTFLLKSYKFSELPKTNGKFVRELDKIIEHENALSYGEITR